MYTLSYPWSLKTLITREGLVLVMGDMNIDVTKYGDSSYYLKRLAEEYQSIVGECGLDLICFGITLRRIHKDGTVFESAIDHALTIKPAFINDIDYSDHNMINVELNIKIPKAKEVTTASRDYRKLRSNQYFFLKKLAKIEWD